MLTFSRRMVLMARYREWLNRKNAELDRPIDDCPEAVLAFLDTNGLIDETAANSFIFEKKEADACDPTTTPQQN